MEQALKRRKIMIVDDDTFDSSIIESSIRLVSDDSEIAVVNDSKTAAQRFAEFDPDLTLLDISMPDVDGFQVLSQIVPAKEGRKKPIVMLSGSTNPQDRSRALELGAHDYKVKPSSITDYQHLAKDLLDQHTA